MVILGTKSLNHLNETSASLINQIGHLGYKTKPGSVLIKNIFATFNLKDLIGEETHIDLRGYAKHNYNPHGRSKVSYENEIFPGAICEFEKMKITLFTKGKINFVGATSIQDIENAFNYIYLDILPFIYKHYN